MRAALQVNPYEYQGRSSPSRTYITESDYNRALLDACELQGIELFAVTDHWRVDSALQLIRDAADRGIVALPGFEANSAEGVHILVIFETDTDSTAINAAIGMCGVSPGCANGTPGLSFTDILEKMTAQGALVIPAHVNVPNSGLLTGRGGPPLVTKIMHPSLHALGITPSQPDGTDQTPIVNGSKPYDRAHPLAIVYADDVTKPATLQDQGASCWYKISRLSVDSLKLAVRTPETRISLTDPAVEPRPMLKEISWVGGYLDGVKIPFSTDLTALIGGRGTGKSTAIESLRFVLGITPIGADAQRDHNNIVKGVLKSGTVVKLLVETSAPSLRTFAVERSINNLPVVKDESGTVTSLQPSDVIANVEIFGQHELAELTNDSSKVASMLQRFQGSSDLSADHIETLSDLRDNREQLKRVEESRAQLEDELADIPRLKEQVQHYTDTDVPTRLKEVTRLTQDDAVFAEARERVSSAIETLTPLTDPELAAKLAADFENIADSPHVAYLERVQSASITLSTTLASLAAAAQDALASASAVIATAQSEWTDAVRVQRNEHDEVLRKLVEEGLEPNKYLDTTKALETLKAKESRRASIATTRQSLQSERITLLQTLGSHENNRARELTSAVRAANATTGGVVIVKPVPASDRGHIKSLIEQCTSGQRNRIMAAVDQENFSTREFVEAARRGESELNTNYSIVGAQARSVLEAGEHLFRQLEELSVGQAVEVQLDVQAGTSTREFKKMGDLSKGQSATALLLLLLGASNAPLVIDQPEDDLDNRFVYDGIVKNLRNLKGK
ncbi:MULTISPECIES: AAA family ATPase [unclassified Rhodococcus (in: high G+C Gram-positive bacteria)]|uniref:AAA family ATPase n=1 Tax=unclassified Rhodococcus (in: high G+C Gram-positive bacteria) TaxID=192944 RepID=UPI001B349553|nr:MULTISPECIES: AAA family ATPase [unclassified Rhodococcus (in: high G+C Gram-positive bacteria)]